jgi:hypothetical protein
MARYWEFKSYIMETLLTILSVLTVIPPLVLMIINVRKNRLYTKILNKKYKIEIKKKDGQILEFNSLTKSDSVEIQHVLDVLLKEKEVENGKH